MPLISVIVPVYNVEKYLRRCADSILDQTFTDFELILVDDGSPDGCPAICDEYARRDSRIRVIHKENGGLSDARNAGLDIARGDYIGFVDSDDYILPDMYANLIDKLEFHEADMVACGFHEVDMDDTVIRTNGVKECDIILTRSEFLEHYFPENYRKLTPAVWCKLYRQELFRSYRFPVGMVYEDNFAQLPLFDCCEKIVLIKEIGYCYLVNRSDSIMNAGFSQKNLQMIDMVHFKYQFFVDKGLDEQRAYAFEAYIDQYLRTSFTVRCLHSEFKTHLKPYVQQFTRKIPEIIRNPKMCRMKKIVAILSRIIPSVSFRMTQHFFPECLPVNLR